MLELTITQIRNLSGALFDDIFYTADAGQEGIWQYDPTDTFSNDNTGTILLTADNKRIKRIIDGDINISWFGAKGDGSTDNKSFFETAFDVVDSVVVSSGVFAVSSMIFPKEKTVFFKNGGRILIKSDEKVHFSSNIIASQDDWIFDCEDIPTNYSNQALGIETKIPLNFAYGSTIKQSAMTSAVSVKWFGATGAGFNSTAVADYYTNNVLPTSEFIDDTKAIRFALTAIAESLELVEGSFSFAYGGPNTLKFPKGCYCVDETLYVSGGCFLEGDGALPSGGSLILQVNPSKDLLVLQSKGAGGLGGGSSSHILRKLIVGVRPNYVSNSNSSVIRFEDNKSNLDSRFYDLRFSNCPFNGSFIAVDKKNGRYSNDGIGVGGTVGMALSLHIYDSMLDVGEGDFLKVGESAIAYVRIYNTQFFDNYRSIATIAEKIESDLQGEKTTIIEWNNCNFEGCTVVSIPEPASLISCNDKYTQIHISNCKFNSQVVEDRTSGGKIEINKAMIVYLVNNFFHYKNINSPLEGYFFKSNSHVGALIIKGNTILKDNEGAFQSVFFDANFSSDFLDISDNNFIMPTGKQTHIYFENPGATVKTGVIKNNVFDYLESYDAIFGNPNPGILLLGNIFKSPQATKANALKNYGMKGRTEFYSYNIPTTGTHFVGDRAINDNVMIGQPKAWICTTSGSPGVWTSEGNL